MTSSEKLPKTYFSENREGCRYSVRTATWATQSWNKHKDMQQEGWQARKKKTDAWVSTGHEYAADAAEFTTVAKLKFRQIWFDWEKVK